MATSRMGIREGIKPLEGKTHECYPSENGGAVLRGTSRREVEKTCGRRRSQGNGISGETWGTSVVRGSSWLAKRRGLSLPLCAVGNNKLRRVVFADIDYDRHIKKGEITGSTTKVN